MIGLLERAHFTVERFRVGDYYPDRSITKQLKVFCYQMLARLTRWHCAAAMLIVARR